MPRWAEFVTCLSKCAMSSSESKAVYSVTDLCDFHYLGAIGTGVQ
jgi:hypothetical protein